MNRFAEVIETLRHGEKIPFDKEQIERWEPFAGVYAWWVSAGSPRPVKPMIRPIRAGECMRVGGAGVLPGKNPDRRLWKGVRYMPGVLTYSERDRWYTLFQDLAAAEEWCRKTVLSDALATAQRLERGRYA